VRDIHKTIDRIEQRTWGTQHQSLDAQVQAPRRPTIRGWRAPDAKPRAAIAPHHYFRKEPTVASITARAIKVTIPLSPESVLALAAADGQPRLQFIITHEDTKLRADVAAKSVRKAQTTIREAGARNCFVIIQGKIGRGGEILECGLVARQDTSRCVIGVSGEASGDRCAIRECAIWKSKCMRLRRQCSRVGRTLGAL
jgi:hypothetical protein